MLELKLAMYIDFPSHMNPGIVVTCADDIELYSIGEFEYIRFDKPGFTALAHPSSLTVGTTHGVFVLDPSNEKQRDLEYRCCHCFLHKPSIEKMHQLHAVCRPRNFCPQDFARGDAVCLQLDSEYVYTDSLFYMDHNSAKKLLAFYEEIGTLNCEIDAYGDFLQALGPGATVEYTRNTSNVTKEESNLVHMRQTIFHLLKGTSLNVVVLNNSKFYHIGTTEEYLFHFTSDSSLKLELGLQSVAFSSILSDIPEHSGKTSCIIHSILDSGCSVAPGSVVEYSRLGPDVCIGENCIISCSSIIPNAVVPAYSFLYSLSLKTDEHLKYSTIAFGVQDNLKNNVKTLLDIKSLQFFGVSFLSCLESWNLKVTEKLFSGSKAQLSLWTARIFPVCSSVNESVTTSLKMLNAVKNNSSFNLSSYQLVSIEEMLICKDVEDMIAYRKKIFLEINLIKKKPDSEIC